MSEEFYITEVRYTIDALEDKLNKIPEGNKSLEYQVIKEQINTLKNLYNI